jgi:threonine dehydrogenase-like Zn-dependent dehydrogenase
MSEAVTQEARSDLPSELVAVSDAMAVGWYYAKKAAMSAREIPLVIGCGAIGLAVIAALRRRGIGPIVAADFSPSRRAVAKTMGADIVIDPEAVSPYAAWREVAYGDPDLVRGIFDTVDLPGCLAFECLGFGGGPQMFDWNEALEEVCSCNIDVRPIVGEIIGLDAVSDALERAMAWRPARRCMRKDRARGRAAVIVRFFSIRQPAQRARRRHGAFPQDPPRAGPTCCCDSD